MPDLRAVALGAGAWAGALLVLLLPGWVALGTTCGIVLLVGFGKHGFHFFSLFVPSGTPALMIPLIFVVELMSFLVRPFSLGLRLFVAMTAGHILLKVLAAFVINGINLGGVYIGLVTAPSMLLMIGITLLELLVAAIQAYVFALLTALYINDAVNLH